VFLFRQLIFFWEKKEIAEQLKGSREEEVVRNTDKRLHQLQETTIIQINNDIVISLAISS
jgi:hypothetical protein